MRAGAGGWITQTPSLLLTLNMFQTFFYVSIVEFEQIVDFEQLIVNWGIIVTS